MVSTLLLVAGIWAGLILLALVVCLGLAFYNGRKWPEPPTKITGIDPYGRD